MNNFVKKCISSAILTLSTMHTFAADTINVTVQTRAQNGIAIGFSVDGQNYGGLGKSYKNTGPKNKEYFFGYLKDSIFGEHVICGSLILTQNSTVTLITQNNQCISILG